MAQLLVWTEPRSGSNCYLMGEEGGCLVVDPNDPRGPLSLLEERGWTPELILLTRFPKSPGAALASVVLQCGTNESPLQMGSVAARVAMIFVLDVLFSEVCRRDLEGCRQRRREVADALSEKHV